ncbi:calcium-binding protein [Xanthobacter agilis]|uniref:calcium-binding protein n=1 Tax=Xanthobacter agilis TaxID=47492 RepID=UPI003729973C
MVQSVSDIVEETAGDGTDTVQTALPDYDLSNAPHTDNVENLVYTGSSDFTGFGNDLANAITGRAGNDFLDGGAGDDTVTGGLGDDTYRVDTVGDTVTEAAGEGVDTVWTYLSSYTLPDNFENLFTWSSPNFTGIGNALANDIESGYGDDILRGGAGNDTLYADDGNDRLDGGSGDDTLEGGAGADTYVVDSAGDTVTEAVSEGTDRVFTSLSAFTLTDNVENLTYTGASSFTGTGNSRANAITGGAAADVLNGGAGADTLTAGTGNDRLNGGAGDDTLVGEAGNDTLTAGAGNDRLNGGSGDDTLVGGAGTDILTGGAGADTFIYTSVGSAVDTITDFSAAQGDLVDLSAIDANTLTPATNNTFVYIGGSGFSGSAGELRFSSNTLQADVNGDKVADLSITLSNVSSLSASSLVL